MSKISKLFGMIALAFITLFAVNVNAEAITVQDFEGLNGALSSDQTIELSKDITLDSKLTVLSGKTITIDLKGHKITGPTSGYAIQNQGNLTIKDTGSEKGSITCVAKGASCIANDANATMTVEGVTIVNPDVYAGIINRSENGLTVKDSVIDVTATGGTGIHNYGKATVQGTTINLKKTKTTGVMNYGEATIKDTKIAGPVIGSATSIGSYANDSFSNSKTTVENVTITGTAYVWANKDEETSGTTELTIDGLKGAKQITAGDGATVKPDAENTANVMKLAVSGSKIVVPDDYDGELIQNKGVKYVNSKGTEVVYVTYQGVRYEITKGSNWTTNSELLAKLKSAANFKNKLFVKFVNSKGNQVTGGSAWNESDTVYAIYTITVKFNEEDYTLELGRDGASVRIGNATTADGKRLDDAMKLSETDKNKYVYVHYYDATGNQYNQGTMVDCNVGITKTVYGASVKINGSTQTLEVGSKLSESSLLADVAKKANFKYFVDSKGKHYQLSDTLESNLELRAVYAITVTFNGEEYTLELQDGKAARIGNATTADGKRLDDAMKLSETDKSKYVYAHYYDAEGREYTQGTMVDYDVNIITVVYGASVKINGSTQTLEVGSELSESSLLADVAKKANFKYFVDSKGKHYQLSDKLESNLELRAVYAVTVTFDGEEYTLELQDGEATEIGKAKNASGQTLEEAMKNFEVPANKNGVYFVNENGEIVYDTTTIAEEMTIFARYTINVEINGETTTLDEGTKVSDVEFLKEITEEEGFLYFVDENGNKYTSDSVLDSNVRLTAVYAVVKPTEEPKVEDVIPSNPETLDGITSYSMMCLIALITMISSALVAFKSKLFN